LLRKLVEAFPCLIVNIRDLGEYLPLEPEIFDIVIIDEASQVSIAQAFPAILRGKKVVVLGDKKQYSNVKSHNASVEMNNFLLNNVKLAYNGYISNFPEDKQQVLSDVVNMFDVKKSVLDFLTRIANYSCSLRKHFRGYPELISYSNKHFYNSYLQVMKIRSRPADTVLNFHILENVEEKDLYSNVNSFECECILNKLVELKEEGSCQSVGIITPFTNQQRYIYGEILSHEDSEYFLEKLNLKVMTFDTCQGDEKDIIFYSFVERPDEDNLKYIFLKDLRRIDDEEEGSIKAQRLNVGFSRAKEEMHFILSKNFEDISGEIGQALKHYFNQLQNAKKLPSPDNCQSEMEKFVLGLLTQTDFYKNFNEDIEVHAQFPIGKYLKQIHDIETPKYRTDFLVVLRDGLKKAYNIVIEYDGFEYHFKESDNIGIQNYDKFYVEQDVERQKILESYGYHFIRLNKFIVRNNPIGYLDKRFSQIVKNRENNDPLIEQVLSDAEEIARGNIKRCPKCGLFKDIKEFVDYRRSTGLGRYCNECKAPKKKRKEPFVLSEYSKAILDGLTEKADSDQVTDDDNGDSVSVEITRPLTKKEIIENAIKAGKTLKIDYRSRYNNKTSRTIKPISINGDFLRAYCHLRRDNRTFRISHIKGITDN
jgi:very-short-patch-repair endonuclease